MRDAAAEEHTHRTSSVENEARPVIVTININQMKDKKDKVRWGSQNKIQFHVLAFTRRRQFLKSGFYPVNFYSAVFTFFAESTSSFFALADILLEILSRDTSEFSGHIPLAAVE